MSLYLIGIGLMDVDEQSETSSSSIDLTRLRRSSLKIYKALVALNRPLSVLIFPAATGNKRYPSTPGPRA